MILEHIAAVEKLEDASELHTSVDNFDIWLNSDFEISHSPAIRYFFVKDQQTYEAQLRMFLEDGEYFITESDKWPEQHGSFSLLIYLEALKYLPEDAIRQLSPDADAYSVELCGAGGMGDFDRAIGYTPDGPATLEGWLVHLTVSPMYEQDGAQAGGVEDVIHLFYDRV